MKRSLAAFAKACGGRLVGEDRPYTCVVTDTRGLPSGSLYVALRGPRFDGNQFVGAAAAAGAVGAVVDRPLDTAPLPLIEVGDGQEALSRAAAGFRAAYTGPVVGVAGSNGKTTVKEMLAAILSQGGPCLATRGNLNNHIGVPLTLLRLEPSHAAAVVEIGANHPGEVAALAALARPDVGLITNAGAEHLEGFGDLDGVARAEGEMVASLRPEGHAILNFDDPYFDLWRGMTAARVSSFGLGEGADFRAVGLAEHLDEQGFSASFDLVSPAGRRAVRLNVGGRHNVVNALCAAAAAMAAGASLDQVAAGLASMRPVAGRLQPKRTTQGARLIDDSYNANPSSVRAGIDVLAAVGRPAWLVFGDMGELGEHARQSHVDIGRYARERGIERLYATGPLATLAVEAFGAGANWYPDTEALARAVGTALHPDVTLLVKGSRSNRLERVVAALTGTTEGAY